MKKKHKKRHSDRSVSAGYDQAAANSDFYSPVPTEQPLYQDKKGYESRHVHKTGRHKAVAGRRKETADPREKMALLAVLRAVIVILLLIIALFMLWKGISLYEEKLLMDNQAAPVVSPVMSGEPAVEEFDIENNDARKLFVERIEVWKEAERLVRSADALLLRNNLDQAIERCQNALNKDPSHLGALERLGKLYFKKEMYAEAINAYVRLLGVDPSRADLQEQLIQALDAREDPDAVIYMARWYQEQNNYDEDVQRYLAHALYSQEDYAAAAEAYARVLKDDPRNASVLRQQINAYMMLKDYEKALAALERLREINYRDQKCYLQIAVCNAQLGKAQETVQTLGKGAHLFGQNVVVGWVQDHRLDPVREDRSFQAFVDRVGSEEFRKWLEQVARSMEGPSQEDVDPQLNIPDKPVVDEELLIRRK